jgi:hypothetical protein
MAARAAMTGLGRLVGHGRQPGLRGQTMPAFAGGGAEGSNGAMRRWRGSGGMTGWRGDGVLTTDD